VSYYLGIDGGGTKTSCAVGDENSVLATAVAGSSNITRVGETRARESLHNAIREGCAAAGIDSRQIQRACIGAAGAGREEGASLVRKMIAEVISGEIEVVGDMPIALQAAFGAGPGVIVLGGTGSFAYGRDESGRTARAGGWGFAISDEGSAQWIGLRAVREALRAADKSTAIPPLLEQLMQVRHDQSFDEFVRAANSSPDFAAFFPAVVSMAESGDSTASRVLVEAGVELANLAAIVIGKLFGQHDPVPVALAGGVFRYAPMVRESFYNEIRVLHQSVSLNMEVVDPVHGALQMARQGGR